MRVNDPMVVAEVTERFAAYERALVAGDVATMTDCFWPAPQVVRFGIADVQRGAAELAAWRAAQPPLPAGRSLVDTVVTTFGDGTAIVTTLFRYPGRAMVGRQSQTWVRIDGAWRIVHAHVSEVPEDGPAGG